MARSFLACALLWAFGAAAADQPDLFIAIRNNDARAAAGLLPKAADANSIGPNGATALMYAALHADTALMKLLLERGANVNGRNPLGATALMWAAGDPSKVRLLIDHGADVNARAVSGRTPLIIASAYPGNIEAIRLLLAKGADPKAVDQTGDGPVGSAASAADVEMLKVLLAAGGSVHERGRRGGPFRNVTPLMRAAGANCAGCVRLLLDSGSDVNAVSADAQTVKAGLQELGRLTALLMAAPWADPEVMRPLIDKGAQLEARDARGITPLMLAVTNERQNAAGVRLLLKRGANADVRAHDGQSALSWARKWGDDTEIVRLLAERGGKPGQANQYIAPKLELRQRSAAEAVERSISLLQSSSGMFFQKSGCVGCHHQMLSWVLIGAARERGLRVDEKTAAEQIKAGVAVEQALRELALQRVPQGGVPMRNSLFLVGLGAVRYPADALTDALVHDLAGMQRVDGPWLGMGQRPPLEYSPVTETAYTMRALQLYMSRGRRPELHRRLARARDWLLSVQAELNEERVMQLLGLHWSGGSAMHIRELARPLMAAQRPDGGWAQRPGFASDAYATGQALYALHEAAGRPAIPCFDVAPSICAAASMRMARGTCAAVP
ncbi:MAG TPA: ankyrin repeat domain-containing protein [Bryobacteraceae bacterium]|nr:ankyrin repeat domain-containing protein [Bryobacteraceae bacterium]